MKKKHTYALLIISTLLSTLAFATSSGERGGGVGPGSDPGMRQDLGIEEATANKAIIGDKAAGSPESDIQHHGDDVEPNPEVNSGIMRDR